MANERNGRNVSDDDRQSWRPQDEGDRNRRSMSDRGDRDWDSHWDDRSSRMSDRDDDRSIERYGQGQSGYGAGRYENDRSYGSRNQGSMSGQSRDRGSDERFTGGGTSNWGPQGSNMQGSQGTYGHSGRWDEDHGGGYLGQSGQQMGYDQGHPDMNRSAGMRGQYAQGGYREEQGRGGQQDRYGAQGYQGWSPAQQQDQRFSQHGGQHEQHRNYGGGRAIGEPRYSHPGQHGYGQGFGQAGVGGFGAHGMGRGFSDQGVSGSGYGHQPEHDTSFRSGQGNQQYGSTTHGGEVVGIEGNEFSHERMYGRGREQNMYGDRYSSGTRGYGTSNQQGMYGQQAGLHRGKGPSGYTRSDDRIREMVCDVLTDHHDIDATHIEVSVKNGEVTLSGSVEDRRTKRLAEDVVEDLSGVREVVNNLRVMDRRNQSSSMTGSGTSVYTSGTSDKTSASAVEKSPPEQAIQSGNNNGTDGNKRHRA